MASFLDSASVPVAAPERNHFDLSTQHITTSDFMELDCAYIRELTPGESIDIKMETFARMEAMPVPTFGRAVIKKSKFFVPMRLLFPAFSDYVSDSQHVASNFNYSSNGIPQTIPTISNSTLVELFVNDTTDSGTSYDQRAMCYRASINDTPDFELTTGTTGSNSNVISYIFTDTGRQVYKLLTQLGYSIVWSRVDGQNGFDADYSALPLLGFLRIYADYYWPSQYHNAIMYQNMISACKKDDGTPYVVAADFIRPLLKQAGHVQYDASSSPFVACWDQPNQPSYENYSDNFVLKNIDTIGQTYYKYGAQQGSSGSLGAGYVSNNMGNATTANTVGMANAPFISPSVFCTGANTTTVPAPISEYLLKSLKALTSFMKRNQLVGSRAYERLCSRYGVVSEAERLNRAVFLGSETQAIQIGDVMSTSDTEGANLGSYAGKGLSAGMTHLQYDTKEFGYVFILTSIVPMASTYQGCDPITMRINRTDFYQPEFDSLGVEAVPAKVLYTPSIYNAGFNQLNEQVFGFLPRYAWYKVAGKDKLTGNFRVSSLNGYNPNFPMASNGASSWHLMREFDMLDYPTAQDIVHGIDYIFGANDSWQYKRIFYDGVTGHDKSKVSPDHFTIIHNFEVGSLSPMKKLYDVVDELSVDAEHTHKKINMQVGGVKVN